MATTDDAAVRAACEAILDPVDFVDDEYDRLAELVARAYLALTTPAPASLAAGERFDAVAFCRELAITAVCCWQKTEEHKSALTYKKERDEIIADFAARLAARLTARLAALERERDEARAALSKILGIGIDAGGFPAIYDIARAALAK